jgi:hypothetical protein
MTVVYRIDITKQNCWICDHYRPNNAATSEPNQGSCTFHAPTAIGAVTSPGADPPGATEQDTVGSPVLEPSLTYCGDFKKWWGTPRVLTPVVE